jgi:hypothetical protein
MLGLHIRWSFYYLTYNVFSFYALSYVVYRITYTSHGQQGGQGGLLPGHRPLVPTGRKQRSEITCITIIDTMYHNNRHNVSQ